MGIRFTWTLQKTPDPRSLMWQCLVTLLYLTRATVLRCTHDWSLRIPRLPCQRLWPPARRILAQTSNLIVARHTARRLGMETRTQGTNQRYVHSSALPPSLIILFCVQKTSPKTCTLAKERDDLGLHPVTYERVKVEKEIGAARRELQKSNMDLKSDPIEYVLCGMQNV